MIPYDLLLKITESFYEKAKKDILIGYHFRVIENFDEHIPKIADFWNLQLNNQMQDRSHLPFELMEKHKALKVNKGEIGRWVKLFKENLEEFSSEINKDQKENFEKKVDLFAEKMLKTLFRP